MVCVKAGKQRSSLVRGIGATFHDALCSGHKRPHVFHNFNPSWVCGKWLWMRFGDPKCQGPYFAYYCTCPEGSHPTMQNWLGQKFVISIARGKAYTIVRGAGRTSDSGFGPGFGLQKRAGL